jgi:hypothetical protein
MLLLILHLIVPSAPCQTSKDAPLTAKQLEVVWSDLIKIDDEGTKKALSDVAALARQAKVAVPFLKDRLKPVPVADGKKIDQLIADLDGSNFQTREKAGKDLEALGVLAAPAMARKLQQNPSLEVRQRLETLLEKVDGRPMTAEELRGVRAILALETIGTTDARAVLDVLAKGGPGAILTEQAKAALGRVQRRTASK